ncbi:MAG: hypothetical protein AAFN77_22980 [Planctomycetota bacterium]
MTAASEHIAHAIHPRLPSLPKLATERMPRVVVVTSVLLAIVATILTDARLEAQLDAQQDDPPSVELLDSVATYPKPTKFITGRRLDLENEKPISVTWSEIDLRTRLLRFSRSRKIGLFLDRNIDSQSNVRLSMNDVTTDALLWRLASENGASICRVGNVYYLGPSDSVIVLPQRIDELKKETSTNRKNYKTSWHRTVSTITEPLVNPKELLNQMAQTHQFTIVNLEQIPDDLWQGFELPPLPLAEKLQIILTGFGKTFHRSSDGQSITLIDLEIPTTLSRRMSLPSGMAATEFDNLIKRCADQLDSLSTKRVGKRVDVSGDANEVLMFESRLVFQKKPKGVTSGNGKKSKDVFSLNQVTASRKAILNSVASQLSKQLEIAPSAVDLLNQRITIDVQDVTIDQLIKEVLRDTELVGQIEGERLRIGK